MNVNDFYKELFEDVLGLNVLGLQYFYPELIRLIQRRTLSTFSDLIHHRYEYVFIYDQNLINEDFYQEGREYEVKDSFLDKFNIKILGLASIVPNVRDKDDEDGGFTGYAFNPGTSVYDVLLSSGQHTINNMYNFARGRVTKFQMTGPRSFRMLHYGGSDSMKATFKIRYPNIASIPEDYKEIFLELAILDVKNKIWNELKYMEDLPLPGGSMNLKINDYESSLDQRRDYVRDLEIKAFPDRVADNYFTIIG